MKYAWIVVLMMIVAVAGNVFVGRAGQSYPEGVEAYNPMEFNIMRVINSIPTWPDYYEVKDDIIIVISPPDSNDPCVINWDMRISYEKGTKIYREGNTLKE